MNHVTGYDLIVPLHQTREHSLWRARRLQDGLQVVIKTTSITPVPTHVKERLEQEYQIGQELGEHQHLIRYLDLVHSCSGPALILESFDGCIPTQAHQPGRWPLRDFLCAAIKWTIGISNIHQHGVQHGNIKLSNLLWNSKTEEGKVIDFARAQKVGKPQLLGDPFNGLEEQFFSDLHGLGICFYELLTGTFPFQSKNQESGLPVPAHQFRKDIPVIVSDLVDGLLAPKVSGRYVHAHTLKEDLTSCLNQLDEDGYIAHFPLDYMPSQIKMGVPSEPTLQLPATWAKLDDEENDMGSILASYIELPDETRDLLGQAACIGQRFDLSILSNMTNTSVTAIVRNLWGALRKGLICPNLESSEDKKQVHNMLVSLGNGYHFRSETLHTMLISQISEEKKARIHLAIVQTVMRSEDISGRIKTCWLVDQLNAAQGVIDSPVLRLKAATLNLQVAKAYNENGDQQKGLKCLDSGISFLGEHNWGTHEDLAFELVWHKAATSHSLCHMGEAISAWELLKDRAQEPLHKAKLWQLRGHWFACSGQLANALDAYSRGFSALWEKAPHDSSFLMEKLRTKYLLLRKDVRGLLNGPTLIDEQQRMSMSLLIDQVLPLVLKGDEKGLGTCIHTLVNKALVHGNCEESAFAYTAYGFWLCKQGRTKEGGTFGRLGLNLSEKFKSPKNLCRVHLIYGLGIHGFIDEWSGIDARFQKAVGEAQGSDDLYTQLASELICSWPPGRCLGEQMTKTQIYLDKKLCRSSPALEALQTYHSAMRGLVDCDSVQDVAACLNQSEDTLSVVRFHMAMCRMSFLHRNAKSAQNHLDRLNRHFFTLKGTPWELEFQLYSYLIFADFPQRAGSKYLRMRRRANHALLWMEKNAANIPTNFSHLHKLLLAEAARLNSAPEKAMSLFNQAAELAEAQGESHHTGLIAERATRFFLERGQKRTAEAFLRQAIACFKTWGAHSVIDHLTHVYGSIIYTSNLDQDARQVSILPQISALIGETEPGQIEKGLLETALKWTGATRGALLRGKDENWTTVYEGNAQKLQKSGLPLSRTDCVPKELIAYVSEKGHNVLLNEINGCNTLLDEQYLETYRPRSLLCLPMLLAKQVVGVLFLEHRNPNLFKESHFHSLNLFLIQCTHALQQCQVRMDTLSQQRRLNLDLEASRRETEQARKNNHELKAQNESNQNQVAELRSQLEKCHYQEGMVEIADSVLHNVGNLLNSVITSSQMIKGCVRNSKLRDLHRANRLLRMHFDDIESFILEDPRGRVLLEYYLQLDEFLESEQQDVEENVARLMDKITTIQEVIEARQNAMTKGMETEMLYLPDLVRDAVSILRASLERHFIRVETFFDDPPQIPVQRTQFLHMMIHLLKNAREAMVQTPPPQRFIRITMKCRNADLLLSVTDGGEGVEGDKLKTIFEEGYTTKEGSTGMGLHAATMAMKKMGGRIWAESGGHNRGATLHLTLPLETSMEQNPNMAQAG